MKSEADQLQELRDAVFAMADALGAALPRTPAVLAALWTLSETSEELS